MNTRLNAAVALSVALLVACGSDKTAQDSQLNSSTSATEYDVNDVSFLFPLPPQESGIARMIGLNESGNAPQLSKSDYATLVPESKCSRIHPHQQKVEDCNVGGQPNPLFLMTNFKVVALRVDPCAKEKPTDSACKIEFRLVLQPITMLPKPFSNDKTLVVTPEDHALHLIYEVAASEKAALFGELRALKALSQGRTTGKPLGIHPVLSAEGLDGAYGRALTDMIKNRAVRPALRIATHMFNKESDQWIFLKTKDEGGRLVRQQVPFTNKDTQLFKNDGKNNMSVDAPSTASDNVNVIIDSLPTKKFSQLGKAEQDRLIDAAIRIDNPLKHTPDTLDCLSCHAATRSLVTVRGPGILEQDGNVNRYVTPAGISGKRVGLDQDNSGWSVRAFGYFDFKPSITMGVINDSARIADYLRKNDTGAAPSTPAPSSPGTPRVELFAGLTDASDGRLMVAGSASLDDASVEYCLGEIASCSTWTKMARHPGVVSKQIFVAKITLDAARREIPLVLRAQASGQRVQRVMKVQRK